MIVAVAATIWLSRVILRVLSSGQLKALRKLEKALRQKIKLNNNTNTNNNNNLVIYTGININCILL